MESLEYDPRGHARQIFLSRDALKQVPEILEHIHAYKCQLDSEIEQDISRYNLKIEVSDDINQFLTSVKHTKAKSYEAQQSIASITDSIQSLDDTKKNLVLLMTVLKRLQMLLDANTNLNAVISTHDYKRILLLFGVVKELSTFFKSYKSIPEINQLNMMINNTQNKLVDDIFIDFEESLNQKSFNDQLIYGCEILEIVDLKYKDKLLSWFYNHQLKEITAIFNNLDEAGSLDNVERRYLYFQNVLSSTQNSYLRLFPQSWNVDVELCKLFCRITRDSLSAQLNLPMSSASLLDALTKTLNFERYLSEKFNTKEFDRMILRSFEPHLLIWVREQDKTLDSKMLEFMAAPKIPNEFIETNDPTDFLTALKVNSVPNISNSSIELFRAFQKILTQIVKLSTGSILRDVTNLFAKYLRDFNRRILSPIIPGQSEDLNGIEPIKYLTMILNTSDYIINNMNDLQIKIANIIDPQFKEEISFELVHEEYINLISRSVNAMLWKISSDLQFAWRQFANNNWNRMEYTTDVSTYMLDFKSSLIGNCQLILPLIMREGYGRNFCDKVVELVINAFMNNIRLIKPLSIVNIEQILLDLTVLKSSALKLPLYANPNYDESKQDEKDHVSKAYERHVSNQFHKLETLLKLLLTPTLPVENLVQNYFQLIGDRSRSNFVKVLQLKNISPSDHGRYLENFDLQLGLENSLIDESPIMASIAQEPTPINTNVTASSPSPEPMIRSPRLLTPPTLNNIKINNLEKNLRELALNGESHVSKFNENFKNIGKFFRKADHNE